MISWMREKLAALPRRAPEPDDPPGVTVPASLVRSANLAAWMAYIALVYFLLLYTFDIARDRAGTMHFTHIGFWTGDVRVYAPYLFGFFVVAVGIPYVAKISIPTFMSLDWRMNFWPKMWALFIATAVSLVVIAGTFTVQGDTLLERDRESAVAVAQVEQSNAVLQAQIAAKEAELRSMMENRNAYLAQAASVGATEWQSGYIDQTSANDPQRERIVRALGAARAADTLRSDIAALRSQSARATTAEAVASRVTTADTSWIAATLGWLEGARAILLSLVMDIVCLIMPWIALRLEQARNRQLATTEPREFDAAHAIPDLRAETEVVPEPMEPIQEAVFVDGKKSEAAKKGWDTRKRVAAMSELRDLRKQRERLTRQIGKAAPGKALDDLRAKDAALLARIEELREIAGEASDEKGAIYAADTRVAMAAAGVVMAPSVAAGEPLPRESLALGDVSPLILDQATALEHEDRAEQSENRDQQPVHAPDSTTDALDEETLNAIAALNADTAEDPDPAHTLPNNEGVLVADDEAPAPRRELVEEDA